MKCTKLFLVLAGVAIAACIGVLTGCAENKTGSTVNNTSAVSASNVAQEVTVRMGVTGAVYDELWAPAKEALKAEGINLVLVQFADYVTPNRALDAGDIDLNAFQHRLFLQNEVQSHGYRISNIGNTVLTPSNLYPGKIKNLADLKDGAVVAIPNDPTNGGRALKVLEAAGLVSLKPDAGDSPSVDAVSAYPTGIVLKELAANTVPSALPDVAAAIVQGNYALDFGLKTSDAIFPDPARDKGYWCLVAARDDDLKDPAKVELYRKIVEAFQTPATEVIFKDKYGGYYIPVGWDEDLLPAAQTTAAANGVSTVKTVRYAHTQNYPPYDFTTEDGKDDGFEVAVMKAVDELIPEYQFEIVGTSDDDLLIGVNSGKYAVGTKGIWFTEERAKKYIFPKESIAVSVIGIAYRAADADKIHDMESFARFSGKLVPIAPQSAQYSVVVDYNNNHPDNQIKLIPADTFDVADAYPWLIEGRYDAYLAIKLSHQQSVEAADGAWHQYADKLKYAAYKGIPTWPLFNANMQDLADKYDAAYVKLKADGTIARLSEQYFGEDIFQYGTE
jgi:YaeC family lipoprotein